jgi:hypothetical protein
MIQVEKKYFGNPANGKGNFDSAEVVVGENEWINMENCRSITTDAGKTNIVESIGSTLLISNPYLPTGTNIRIGSVEDEAESRIVYFLWNSNLEHSIFCYDRINNAIYTVLLSSQTAEGLGFEKNNLIDAQVVNGICYWVDNLNQNRKINISAGVNMNHPGTYAGVDPYVEGVGGIEKDVITLIRKPPNYALTVLKADVASTNDFMSLFSGKFATYYTFRDGEISTLSPYSPLVPYNTKNETFDCVDVTLPISETIPQDVQSVRIAVQFGIDPNFFVIKIWDKDNTVDAAAIAAHNAGTTALTYRFFNDQTGSPLADAYSVKPFDSVPRVSETLEVVDNRLHLGNNLEGYTSPTKTSLAATLTDVTSGTSVQGDVWAITYNGGSTTRYVVYIPSPSAGYYRVTADDTVAPSDPTAFAALTFISASQTDVFRYYVPTWPVPPINSFSFQSYITVSATPNTLVDQVCYKSGAPYQLGVVFYDRWMRQCGVVENGVTYQTADRSYGTVAFTVGLQWTLSNTDALTEIPDWAEYYSVVRTKCLRTSFFLQAQSKNINTTTSLAYVARDANNDYTFTTYSYASTLFGIGVDISNLQNFGMGYTLSEGDILKLYIDGDSNVYSLKILDQSGQWLVCELQDIGTVSTTSDVLFEIYTPYKGSLFQAYYEIGETYPVNNPGTSSRAYSVLTDSIRGDVTLLSRGTSPADYITECMSPNDTYYSNWFTDAGRVQIIDKIGEQRKPTNISYSNTYIQGTRTNGLSSFEALNEKNLPEECGAIRKLQLTSKVQNEQGGVMLAICERETASLYMGEVQQYGSNASSVLTASLEVIGTINVLKGSFGTVNPESVTEFRGSVFWYDANNGRYIQYSSNGLYPISQFNCTRYWNLFSKQYLSMTTAQFELLGSRPFVFSAADPHHGEILISVPKLLSAPPKGYLPDYPSTEYPFDIWDGRGKTMVYKLVAEPNHWQGSFEFNPEGFVTLQNSVYAFKDGNIYLCNQTSSTVNLFGSQKKARIMFVSNAVPTRPKVYNNIVVEANMRPSLTYFRTEPTMIGEESGDLEQQASDLMDFDYKILEGQGYATLYRNKLIPTQSGLSTSGLLTGNRMRALVLKVMLEFSPTTTPLQLKFVQLGFSISHGHKT